MITPCIQLPIADLRREPVELQSKDFSHHPLRETQLLYGDPVTILEEKQDWYLVEVPWQKKYSVDRWQGYPGWIKKEEIIFCDPLIPNAISLLHYGTYLHFDGKVCWYLTGKRFDADKEFYRLFPKAYSPHLFLSDLSYFMKAPYLWGGCSFYSTSPLGSVDCSSLIYMLFRGQGFLIPRDAHDQYLKCQKISKESMQPGDLVYLHPKESTTSRITHVVIYLDEHTLIDAPHTGKNVQKILHNESMTEILKLPGREKEYKTYFCSYSGLVNDLSNALSLNKAFV